MPEPDENITDCHSCGNAMDVSAVAPFSNVECPTCGERNRVKTEFGHYTLTRRLAEGGMSLVFVAMDNTLGREVALKILNEDYSADEKRIKAFEEEARITASFSHPHVVRVFTTGRAFGRFYIAMELVPGGHFEHQIRERGIIPEIEILPFAVQVAEGLEAARAAGLIHRDVKPGNILLDSLGNAKIVDFGLALVTKGGSATAQEIWATPYYVPPETIEGHEEDFRSDLYAFGATLYHALAGKPSCDEKSMATDVLRQAKRHVKALRFAAPDVSDETCAIVDRAMAFDRNARFGSYEEMILQLKAALGRLKKGGVDTAASKAKRRGKLSRGEWLAIGAAALVLVGAGIGGIAWIAREEPKKPGAKTTIVETPEIVEDKGGGALIGQRYRVAREAVESGQYEKAREIFGALRDDREVQEPTRTWAAVEAVVVTFLDGRANDAKQETDAAIRHIKGADLEDEKLASRLLGALGAVQELSAVKPEQSDENGDAAWTLSMMLGGLKNWEQGLTDSAASQFFKPISSVELKSKDQWVKSYQKIAAIYLKDHLILTDPVFDSLPKDQKSCQKALDHLDGLTKKVSTRGRIKFNIKAWKFDIARQLRLLNQPVAEKPKSTVAEAIPAAADPLMTLAGLSKDCKFTEALDFIKSLSGDPPGTSRDSLIAIHTSAANFLKILEDDLTQSATPVQLRSKAGDALEDVKISAPGIIAAGGTQYSWGDIEPESAIQFYRTNARTKATDVDHVQRHECAIAYDWLVGDRARASLAAERLAAESYLFKRRWDLIVSGLPK